MSTPSWSDLFLTGSIVDIEMSMWRARTKIKPEDLGIEDSAEVSKALSLGCHRLAPAKAFEELNLISGQAWRSLEYYSLHFAMIKGARYVPHTNLNTLLSKMRDYKREYMAAVDKFMQNYEKTKADMLPVIEKALKDASGNEETARAAFDRVRAEYPSSQEVRMKFGFRWSVYAIQSAKNESAKAAAEEEAESIKSVVRGMIEQLRGEVTKKITVLTELIGKGGKVPKQSIESARALILRIEGLNVMGDNELNEQTRALGRFLDALEDDSQNPSIAMGLTDMKKNLEESIDVAVKEAEERLTGVGKRKLAVD